jgi:hypothetical protein
MRIYGLSDHETGEGVKVGTNKDIIIYLEHIHSGGFRAPPPPLRPNLPYNISKTQYFRPKIP